MKTFYHLVSAVTLFMCFTAIAQENNKAHNPIVFADVPDISIIRVDKTYYMSSTTMHMSPGVPIMKSDDLVNWKIISYAYDRLTDNDAMNLNNGKNTYGRGSWASSLRHHNGTFYVSTFSATSGRTHIYSTKNIEKGPWKAIEFEPSLHDHSLFFDDDGNVYMLYGTGSITLVQLKPDLTGILPGTEKVIIENASAPAGDAIMLKAEGSQFFKIKGKYYLFNITWPKGGMRTVVIHRANKISGPYEGKLGLQDIGVAQGGLIDTWDGKWFSYLFRDYGAVGRIPYLVPVAWQNGWPVLGNKGKVPEFLDLPKDKSLIPGIADSDDFDRKKGQPDLPLVWQWNHNPDNALWSLTKKPGYLRLTTGRVETDFLNAKNTITQRTIGPVCTGYTALNITGMKDGDFAGLALLQKNYGQVGIKIEGKNKFIIMVNAGNGEPVEAAHIPFTENTVHFKAECDFTDKKDVADFYYSTDGKNWKKIGTPLKMSYTLPHFMGYRFGLFNYATKEMGGYADFDYYRIDDKILN
jgi:beta-xylosidase